MHACMLGAMPLLAHTCPMHVLLRTVMPSTAATFYPRSRAPPLPAGLIRVGVTMPPTPLPSPPPAPRHRPPGAGLHAHGLQGQRHRQRGRLRRHHPVVLGPHFPIRAPRPGIERPLPVRRCLSKLACFAGWRAHDAMCVGRTGQGSHTATAMAAKLRTRRCFSAVPCGAPTATVHASSCPARLRLRPPSPPPRPPPCRYAGKQTSCQPAVSTAANLTFVGQVQAMNETALMLALSRAVRRAAQHGRAWQCGAGGGGAGRASGALGAGSGVRGCAVW